MSERIKPLLFRAGAIGLSLIALGLLEIGLRAAGVASDRTTPFRRVEDHEDYLVLNARYVERYFGSFAPGVAFTPFAATKSTDVFRVFALGGSTTAGFPSNGYAFPARMESKLEAFLPELRSEVVNLALTATNSWTIRDLSRDVVRYEPDAVVIYAGHNEYYGAFGAGTAVNRLGNQRWLKWLVIRLKRSALYTLLEDFVAKLRPAHDIVGRTMMAEAVGDASIPRGSAVFSEGVRQFETNMGKALDRLCEAGIPVYVGTLTSNLAGQAPLGEDKSAGEAYREGEERLRVGQWVAAREAFVRARELDDLRFRAPDEINAVIRRLANRTCATLVDVGAAVRDSSDHGVESDQLFVDHLHPTVHGQSLIADAFFDAIQTHARLAARRRLTTDAEPRRFDPLGRALADLRVSRLKLGHPFVKGLSPEDEVDRYRVLVRRFARRSFVDSLAALAATRRLAEDEAAAQAIAHAKAQADTVGAMLLYRSLLGRKPFFLAQAEDAILYGAGSRAAAPLVRQISRMWANRRPSPFFANALVSSSLDLGQEQDAERLIAWIRRRYGESPALALNAMRLGTMQRDEVSTADAKRRLVAMLGIEVSASARPDGSIIRNVLGLEGGDFLSIVWKADGLRRAGRLNDAAAAYETALGRRPADLALKSNLATVRLQLGDTTEALRLYRAVLDLDPRFVQAWVNLAIYYMQTGQLSRASEALDRAAAIAPEHPTVRLLRRRMGG